MDLDEIKLVLEMMREHDLAEFELERDGVKLRLRKNTGHQWSGTTPLPQVTFVPPMAPVPPAGDPGVPAAPGGPASAIATCRVVWASIPR